HHHCTYPPPLIKRVRRYGTLLNIQTARSRKAFCLLGNFYTVHIIIWLGFYEEKPIGRADLKQLALWLCVAKTVNESTKFFADYRLAFHVICVALRMAAIEVGFCIVGRRIKTGGRR